MKVHKTPLDGVLLMEPEFRSIDGRGETVCAFEESALYRAIGYPVVFPKHNFSVSREYVLRGIHVSNLWKLAYCPVGFIQAAIVDCREGPTFGQSYNCNINEVNRTIILVPPMFGLGYLVLSDRAVFQYHWSGSFDSKDQRSYRWDDPAFGIPWMIKDPILSERDASAPLVRRDQKDAAA